MELYDRDIAKITEYMETLKAKGKRVRYFEGLPIFPLKGRSQPIERGENSNIILRSDTFVELGNPLMGSCSFFAWTRNVDLISNGKISLMGPDIPESAGQSLPFGQAVMIAGTHLDEEDHGFIERNLHFSNQIEGYMIKSLPNQIWSRVSKNAASDGFSFETLGREFMSILKSRMVKIEAVEIMFVTSSKEDLEELHVIASEVDRISKQIRVNHWKNKGYDIECTFGHGCHKCPDKQACDDIKKVVGSKKQNHRLHQYP